MKAAPRTPWMGNEVWLGCDSAIRPDQAVGIEDDSQVTRIEAEKVIADEEAPWYEVILEGEAST